MENHTSTSSLSWLWRKRFVPGILSFMSYLTSLTSHQLDCFISYLLHTNAQKSSWFSNTLVRDHCELFLLSALTKKQIYGSNKVLCIMNEYRIGEVEWIRRYNVSLDNFKNGCMKLKRLLNLRRMTCIWGKPSCQIPLLQAPLQRSFHHYGGFFLSHGNRI